MAIKLTTVRVRLCEDGFFGRAGTTVTIPVEWAEALIMDKKATPAPVAENKSMTYKDSSVFKGGLDGR